MSRGTTRRAWVKVYITGWLHGSIRWQLLPEERSVWADLICLAGECNKNGLICDNDERPYPLQYIANHLNISLELLNNTMNKCKDDGRLNMNCSGVIEIINWNAYQSEYDRQKKYRNGSKKKQDIKKEPENKKLNVNLPDYIDKDLWDDFLEMRKELRKPATIRAQELLIKDLEKLKEGNDPNEVIKQSIKNSWQGLFALKGDYGGKNKSIPGNRPAGAFSDVET